MSPRLTAAVGASVAVVANHVPREIIIRIEASIDRSARESVSLTEKRQSRRLWSDEKPREAGGRSGLGWTFTSVSTLCGDGDAAGRKVPTRPRLWRRLLKINLGSCSRRCCGPPLTCPNYIVIMAASFTFRPDPAPPPELWTCLGPNESGVPGPVPVPVPPKNQKGRSWRLQEVAPCGFFR